MEQLLATKLHIPSTRPELVRRPRLIDRLNAGLGCKLTLISGPDGFGKTTLLAEWLQGFRLDANVENQTAKKITWLSLDEGDNEIARFLTYFIASLNQAEGIDAPFGKEALKMLQSSQLPPTKMILTSLINQFAEITDQFIFVLDDYHLVESQPVHLAVTFLLEHLPPSWHLIIATREDPPLPLSRLRVRGQLTELRAVDLQFTSPEAVEFLNQAMGLNLSEQDIIVLESRTEGWIAGLQLAALAMQGAVSAQGQKEASTFIKSFTGSHRFVLDYLIEEVIQQQPNHIQTFLLQTAVLNRLTGPLCDAVTGQENGQDTLEMLDRINLFIVPLDHERRWYRYHHLFAELLQTRLNLTQPDLICDLHAKAAAWYEANDDLSEAVHHALTCQDIKTAAHLIEKGSLAALERSDFSFIFNSVNRLPGTALESAPWLFVYHTWALILTGQVEITASRLKNTDWLLESVAEDQENRKRMLGNIAGLKAHLAGWQRDYSVLMEFANLAIENLPENHWISAYCAMMIGVAFWGSGNLAAAKEAFTRANSIGRMIGNKRVIVTSTIYLGHTLELEGHLYQAVDLFQNSIQRIAQDESIVPVAGYLHVDLARVLYEQNKLELAEQHLKEGIKSCQQLSDGRVEKLGHCLLVRVFLAAGDFKKVNLAIQRAEHAHPATVETVDMRGGEYSKIRLWLKQRKLRELEAWLNASTYNLQDISHFKTKLTRTMHARVLIALGRENPGSAHLKDALDLLDQLLELAENNGWGSKVIEILVLQALALQCQQDNVSAVSKLELALTLAESQAYVRTFVDEGPPMAGLLYAALSRGIAPDYVRWLLGAFPALGSEPAEPFQVKVSEGDLFEPLSEREIEVLQLIAAGFTNPEISAKLFISLNTVKVHIRNIFGKLGVNNRMQAGARARGLGILPSN